MLKLLVYLSLLIFVYSCSESTSPTLNINSTLKQASGCNKSSLSKSLTDSSFNYTFITDANIYFSLPANCCPENDRFDQITLLNNNTITTTVIDTAAHLCRCSCNYELNIKISNLTENNYTFTCIYGDSIFYKEEIVRN